MPSKHQPITNRLDLESRVLAAALKQSVDRNDRNGIILAYKELSNLLKQRQSILDQQSKTKSEPSPKSPLKTQPTESSDIYELIGDTPLSTFAEIHTDFLVKVRDILHNDHHDSNSKKLHDELRRLWIAHDILHSPATRIDYDLRRLGVRDKNQPTSENQDQKLINQLPLTIEELVKCLKHAEQNTSEPKPYQQDLNNEELAAFALGQRLIKQGKISIEQFIAGMLSTRSESKLLRQYLLDKNWASESDITDNSESSAESTLAHVYKLPTQSQPAQQPKQLDFSIAVPKWANQLVWDEEVPTVQIKKESSAAPADKSKSSKNKKKKRKSKGQEFKSF